MNKFLIRLCTVILSLGMLGAAACSGCSPSTDDTSKSAAAFQQQSMNCGAYTHRVGNQCVGDSTTAGTTSSTSAKPKPLATSGNN